MAMLWLIRCNTIAAEQENRESSTADDFLFSTVDKYKAEELTKDKTKKKIKAQIDAKTVKGPITKLQAVENATSIPFTSLTKQ